MHNKFLSLWSMMRNERRNLRDLHRTRDAKLRRLVRYASRHVPFYRDLFEACGVRPDTIRTVEDLERLPIIDKARLQTRHTSELISDDYGSSDELIMLRTSGSSGMPLELYINRDYEAIRKAQSLRPYLTNGRHITDQVLYFTGHTDQRAKWFEYLGLLRETRIDSSADPAAQRQALEQTQAQIIQGYPSALTSLATDIGDESIRVTKPRVVFTDSELLTPDKRQLIEQAFGAPVIDVFGSWETGNIAYECDRQTGYHIAMDCVVLEVVGNDGSVVSRGEEGELVCTVLDNLAMPLIRYNLHDIARRATRTCTCGRQFPLVDVIAGRSDDLVRLADGGTVSSQGFLTAFGFLAGVVREFQITQQAIDRFQIVVVPGARFEDAHIERIRSVVRSRYAAADVDVRIAEHIDREASGKLRAFRSLV